MQMITDIQIDLYGEMQLYLVSAKQGDKATRYIRVQLMNSGNEFEIPDDVQLIANIKKPDGKFCYNECEKEDNRVLIQLTSQALAAAGTAYCDIELRSMSGDLILSSAAFTIEIEQSMRSEDAILSSNEMTVLDKKIQDYIDRMMATRQQVLDTEAAFKVAEAARALAEADRIAAESLRVRNEADRVAAEQTRQQQLARMQSATSDAQQATSAANTAAQGANTAAERAEKLYRTQEELEEMCNQMKELKTGIAYTVDGGKPDSVDVLVCDGGTPFTAEEICIDCGKP